METLFLSEVLEPVYDTSAISFNKTLQGKLAINIRNRSDPICVGKSLTAIQKGLELSSPRSVVLVFTDAAPGDHSLLPVIIDTITATSSKVLLYLKLTPL